ncbi:MAG: DUF1295 domain-containing protein [Bacteroidales bacterium]|nr:DUF1295 domain-containing protein [Bacteroidales bacterium]
MILTREQFYLLLVAWLVLAVLIFPLLLRVTVPYGRHTKTSWGPTISNRIGWFVMELPVIIVFSVLFFWGDVVKTAPMMFIYSAFMLHYVHRVFVFPLAIKSSGKRMPVLIVVLAFVFNLINGFFNGYWFGWLSGGYELTWFTDPRFIIGAVLFFLGMYLNISSDYQLINLRKGNKSGYFIPHKGLFKHVSSPNLLGEMIEWTGWAVMSWCLPAAAFAWWTLANLIPRALDHHRWYKQRFPDYPTERTALIPWGLFRKKSQRM